MRHKAAGVASGQGKPCGSGWSEGLGPARSLGSEPPSSDTRVPIARAVPALPVSCLVTLGKSLALKNLRVYYRASPAQYKKQIQVIRAGKEKLNLPLFILNMVFYKDQEKIWSTYNKSVTMSAREQDT